MLCGLFFSGSEQGLLLVVVHGLLIVVASLVAEHRLSVAQAAAVVAHGLSGPAACGIFMNQRSNLCPLHWQADCSLLDHHGHPLALPFPSYRTSCISGIILVAKVEHE